MAFRKDVVYECGSADEATGPVSGHYIWHRRQGTPACDRSRAEKAWHYAESRAGHCLPDYQYKPHNRQGYVCGSADDAIRPCGNHYAWHYRQGSPACDKALVEIAWLKAEEKAGKPLPDYQWKPRPKSVVYECGSGNEADSPNRNHYAWHLYYRTEPCDKSRAEIAWYRVEERAGHSIPDYYKQYQRQYQNREGYVCGSADTAEEPSYRHLQWHKYHQTEPCGKSRKESAWHYAEYRAGQPIPDYQWKQNNMNGYECGTEEEATGPSGKHYDWHKNNNTDYCGKSRLERLWYNAELVAGYTIPDYQRTRNPNGHSNYICGSADEATGPSTAHYSWHRKRDTEPCDKSIREASWYSHEKYVGYPVADYKQRELVTYQCGPAEEAEGASSGHYGWHKWWETEPCPKSKKEQAWYAAEARLGHSLPDYEYYGTLDKNVPTSVYQYSFVDGDRYYGITCRDVETRWLEHQQADTLVGDKIRSGILFATEVLCVAPDRYQAEDIERLAVKSGNPWGRLLNIQHNQDKGQG